MLVVLATVTVPVAGGVSWCIVMCKADKACALLHHATRQKHIDRLTNRQSHADSHTQTVTGTGTDRQHAHTHTHTRTHRGKASKADTHEP